MLFDRRKRERLLARTHAYIPLTLLSSVQLPPVPNLPANNHSRGSENRNAWCRPHALRKRKRRPCLSRSEKLGSVSISSLRLHKGKIKKKNTNTHGSATSVELSPAKRNAIGPLRHFERRSKTEWRDAPSHLRAELAMHLISKWFVKRTLGI